MTKVNENKVRLNLKNRCFVCGFNTEFEEINLCIYKRNFIAANMYKHDVEGNLNIQICKKCGAIRKKL